MDDTEDLLASTLRKITPTRTYGVTTLSAAIFINTTTIT
jgi:hypothetical protein